MYDSICGIQVKLFGSPVKIDVDDSNDFKAIGLLVKFDITDGDMERYSIGDSVPKNFLSLYPDDFLIITYEYKNRIEIRSQEIISLDEFKEMIELKTIVIKNGKFDEIVSNRDYIDKLMTQIPFVNKRGQKMTNVHSTEDFISSIYDKNENVPDLLRENKEYSTYLDETRNMNNLFFAIRDIEARIAKLSMDAGMNGLEIEKLNDELKNKKDKCASVGNEVKKLFNPAIIASQKILDEYKGRYPTEEIYRHSYGVFLQYCLDEAEICCWDKENEELKDEIREFMSLDDEKFVEYMDLVRRANMESELAEALKQMATYING